MKPTLTIILAAVGALTAAPAFAEAPNDREYCAELWFMRNQIYANAGYCFASPLALAMFDNTDCTPGDVTLTSFETALVDSYREEETMIGCAIDSDQTTPLAIPNIEDRRETPWLGGEMGYSGCIGYFGPPFALYADPNPTTPITTVTLEDDLSVIVTTSGAVGTWYYYYVMKDGALRAEGWADRDIDWTACTSNAG